MFKKFLEIIGAVIVEMFNTLLYVLSTSIYPISKLLVILTPYIMVFITIESYKD
jgi:hypothetical protein